MRHFLLTVFLVVACTTLAAAVSIGEVKSAFGRDDYAMAAQIEKAQEMRGAVSRLNPRSVIRGGAHH